MGLNVKHIAKFSWIKYWVGNWSLLTGAYFAYYYTKLMKGQLGAGLGRAVLISRKGYTACYFDVVDRRKFGMHRARQVLRSKASLHTFVVDVKKKADVLVARSDVLKNKNVTWSEFQKFLIQFYEYTGLHISPRNIIDHVPQEQVNKMIKPFTDVRLYTEKVYKKTEEFMEAWAARTGRKAGYSGHLVLCMLPEEVEEYHRREKLPPKKTLQSRFAASAVIFDTKGHALATGKAVEKIEQVLAAVRPEKETKGATAYPGKARGAVRIVFDPHKATVFNEGDILVTGMTRPEFLLLMTKAAAIVTDAGGVLSHAAITARELKKPCIIGTKIATQVFKDGDMVEVDATKGVVRKIK